MQIPKKTWNDFISKMARIDSDAAEAITDWARANKGYSREALIDYCYAISDHYGNAAASLACEMFENIADASGVIVRAEPAETATYEEVAAAVNGTLKTMTAANVSRTVGRLVKQAGADTLLHNSIRYGCEVAWIPFGDTCAFCMMLASRGWERASKKTLKNGHAEHIHTNCNCQYAVRFNQRDEVEGYNDGQEYRDIYYAAGEDGTNWKVRLKNMKRQQYAEHKEEINAQKRKAYAIRKAKKMGLDEP